MYACVYTYTRLYLIKLKLVWTHQRRRRKRRRMMIIRRGRLELYFLRIIFSLRRGRRRMSWKRKERENTGILRITVSLTQWTFKRTIDEEKEAKEKNEFEKGKNKKNTIKKKRMGNRKRKDRITPKNRGEEKIWIWIGK